VFSTTGTLIRFRGVTFANLIAGYEAQLLNGAKVISG
jgi:hypothetical protein